MSSKELSFGEENLIAMDEKNQILKTRLYGLKYSGGCDVRRIFFINFDFYQSCLEAVLKLFGHCFWTQQAHT